MRILIIARNFPAVSQTFVLLHVESLLRLGHDVTVMAAPGSASFQGTTTGQGNLAADCFMPIEYPRGSVGKRVCDLARRLPWEVRSMKLLSLVFADYIRGRSAGAAVAAIPLAGALRQRGEWDIVHVHFGNMALPVAQLCDAGYIHAPVVATFHGTDLNENRKVPKCQLFARVFKAIHLLTVGTEHMAAHLLECGISNKRYRIIPMGVDVSRFRPRTAERTIHSGGRLITVGRLVECKGVEYLIRAVGELRKVFPDVSLDVIGDGPLRRQLEELSVELEVSPAVKFHGAVGSDKVLELLQESDIYVQPGIIASDGSREGQGIVVAEAQAVGLPVVASRVGGIPEIVVEGESAFLVTPKDVSALTDQISLLIQNPALREQMGVAGRAFVEQGLSQEALAKEWVEVYERVIDSYSSSANTSARNVHPASGSLPR